MNQKELTKTFLMISNGKNLHGLYTIISVLKGILYKNKYYIKKNSEHHYFANYIIL